MTVCFLPDLRGRFSKDDIHKVHCLLDIKYVPETRGNHVIKRVRVPDTEETVCVVWSFSFSDFTDVLSSDCTLG